MHKYIHVINMHILVYTRMGCSTSAHCLQSTVEAWLKVSVCYRLVTGRNLSWLEKVILAPATASNFFSSFLNFMLNLLFFLFFFLPLFSSPFSIPGVNKSLKKVSKFKKSLLSRTNKHISTCAISSWCTHVIWRSTYSNSKIMGSTFYLFILIYW